MRHNCNETDSFLRYFTTLFSEMRHSCNETDSFFSLEQAMKAERGNRGIALLFL